MDNYIINPITKRPILFNGAIYRRLLKTNKIQEAKPPVIERKQTNSIEKKPVSINLSEKEQSDNDSDNDDMQNQDLVLQDQLQELFNTLNKNN